MGEGGTYLFHANITLIRKFIGMEQHVILEGLLINERFLTDLTRVLLVPNVRPQVTLQICKGK